MTIRACLQQARQSWQLVAIRTDDGEQLTGLVEELTRWTVTLRRIDGSVLVPFVEIVSASVLRQLGDG
ncbi:hypothetical protein [Paenibacillus glycinis]|uniref:DUF2642 domain-containing protein n=1 Tax=Paenibacillus glycinis TaxID=2697035 RepID=A0ABW9XVI0_9BACL|nr:hypothetical protein [Paenibacillus glycinis]NBD26644.1 hypothetical protein [Paenibacillus glycinis]